MNAGSQSTSEPIEVELFDVFLNKVNAFRVMLYTSDGGSVILDFPPESEGFHRIVDALTQAATQALSSLGNAGVVITGLTETDEGDDQDS
jgi:hypothetical protein